MGLIRLIIFALVVWLVWRMFKNYQTKKQQTSSQQTRTIKKEKMVMCEFCSVHLPEADALSDDNKWFCDKSHMQQFLSKKD